LAAGCALQGPEPRLICHNANCAGGSDTADDTLDALAASLALRTRDGRVLIDGIEIDSVWDRGAQTCRLAHGLAPGNRQPEIGHAARLIERHLAENPQGRASHGASFVLKIELKTAVTTGGAAHTADEARRHARCVLQVVDDVTAASATSDNDLEVLVDSNDPRLLKTVLEERRFLGHRDEPLARTRVPIVFETNLHTPIPDGLVVGVITASQRNIAHVKRSELDLADQRLLVWGRTLTVHQLNDIATKHPAFIGANNAAEVRAFLDRNYGP
jgi:hypothetical protein